MQNRENVVDSRIRSDRVRASRVSTLKPSQIILFSFLGVIVLGTMLLLVPGATVGGNLSVLDALFTATSATCVTGLIIANTSETFTTFGQLVILGLIQIGGLGIMTFSTFFMHILGKRLSVAERDIVQNTFSQQPMANLTRLLKLVLAVTFAIELVGALLLSLRFSQSYPTGEAIYLGIFHAISAFCNAGFDLFSNSFVDYRGEFYVNLVLSCLIILGGLGFVVIYDIVNVNPFRRFRWRKLAFHSQVVLFSSALLLASGFVAFFLLEFSYGLGDAPLHEKLLIAGFQSVTARTAGFNTIDMPSLSSVTLFLLILFMFIGASPGSCGGGIKNSTFMVIMSSVFARLRMQDEVNIFFRRIPESTVSRAISVVFFSMLLVIVFTMLLLITETLTGASSGDKADFLDYSFEVVSAFGTVGLSTGVTPTLSGPGKLLLTILMFVGRLGPLTLALAMQTRKEPTKMRYVQESVLVG